MVDRVTDAELKKAVEQLNGLSKELYGLDWAYGGVKLVRYANHDPTSGQRDVTNGYATKRKIYDIVHAILAYLYIEGKA